MFASVVWPKGRPPSDKPECGFNNELCEWLINGKVTLTNTPVISVFMIPFQPLTLMILYLFKPYSS